MHPLPQYAFMAWCLSKYRDFSFPSLLDSLGNVFLSGIEKFDNDTEWPAAKFNTEHKDKQ